MRERLGDETMLLMKFVNAEIHENNPNDRQILEETERMEWMKDFLQDSKLNSCGSELWCVG